MTPATIVALLEAFIGFVGQIPELVNAIETAIGLVKSGAAPTAEQQAVLAALVTHLAGNVSAEALPLSPDALAQRLVQVADRRTFMQLAIVLELCRHPSTDAQTASVAQYAQALGIDNHALDVVREAHEHSAEEATADFVRFYDGYLPELSEPSIAIEDGRQGEDQAVVKAIARMHELPEGTLGAAFVAFYARNGIHLPGPDTPHPAYYIAHDMNHVITGYEPTGPGEIALGAFKLAMRDDDANWMAFMANILIHEAGLLKHGATSQFVPYGGEIYPVAGQQGALNLQGAAELVAEAFERGVACTDDFSRVDHLALIELPLAEVRSRYNVTPMTHPMA
jgi:hypothetical protein